MMDAAKFVYIQAVEKPARRVILKRGRQAAEYFAYCEEVGCDVWTQLTAMPSLDGEPVCLWLPDKYRKPDTSIYVQGIETALNDSRPIPAGFDAIELPAATYLRFQGETFPEEDCGRAIGEVGEAIRRFNPASIGYAWDEENPRIQLQPIGSRGYIEYAAVKKITHCFT